MTSCKDAPHQPNRRRQNCEWLVRPLAETDLGVVLPIERVSFPSPWTKESFEKELANPFSRCWVALGGRSAWEPVGYLCVWMLVEEMHVMNLATHPCFRRMGVARALLHHAFASAGEMGVRQGVLEVRSSNGAARCLYDSLGFRVAGVRRRYYADTGEDALVMIKGIEPPPDRGSGAARGGYEAL